MKSKKDEDLVAPLRVSPTEVAFLRHLDKCQTDRVIDGKTIHEPFVFKSRTFGHTRAMASLAKKDLLRYERKHVDGLDEKKIVVTLTWVGIENIATLTAEGEPDEIVAGVRSRRRRR